MSYELAVWEGDRPRSDAHARDVFDALRALYTNDDAAPTAPVATYVKAMRSRWPDTDDWAAAALGTTARGRLMSFTVPEQVAPDAAFVARELGLICFDPQRDLLISGQVPADAEPWVAVVEVDQEFFAEHGSYGYDGAPPDAAVREIPLVDLRTRIGRFSRKHVVHPQIDLSIAPADPWISRAHADLVRDAAGGWSLVDLGSEHGVYVNGSADRVPRRQGVALSAGDRIRLGRWTVITVGPGGGRIG